MNTHLRVARATDHIEQIIAFYRDSLGITVIGSFTDHDGFNGVMLGRQGAQYHLEFTQQHDHSAGRAPTKENLLVFYLPDKDEWQSAVQRMIDHG
jgi:catechol 2,3-dioxygenase-like lactoylglutathione lyase family enzyme